MPVGSLCMLMASPVPGSRKAVLSPGRRGQQVIAGQVESVDVTDVGLQPGEGAALDDHLVIKDVVCCVRVAGVPRQRMPGKGWRTPPTR
jgi:hypothetical protein